MKIYAFTRESPDTNNDGTAQKLLIEMCCEYLVKQNVYPTSVIGAIEYFDGQGDSITIWLTAKHSINFVRESSNQIITTVL